MYEIAGDGVGIFFECCAICSVKFGDAHEDLRPRCLSLAAIFWWKIRPAEKGTSICKAEAIERPATVLLNHLHCVHVKFIDVRALLAVYLDIHKMLVHQACDIRIIKTFLCHHVAPMAGGVTH